MADAKNQAIFRELVAELNGDDTNQAEEAQATLEQYGAAVLAPLMDAAPQFGRFGQLCAIELFQKISDPRAGSVLIPMLRSDHDTVREWAAQALGDLGVREAVPELQAAYERAKRSRIPPDWSEPQSIRDALTQLGARDEVIPALVRERIRTEPIVGRCWRPSDLADVIESLACCKPGCSLFHVLGTLARHSHVARNAGLGARLVAVVESARRLGARRRA
jgi:hypothetical protein